MSFLRYYLRRSVEQPFRETVIQARELLLARARAVVQPAYDKFYRKPDSKDAVLRRSGFNTAAELTDAIKSRTSPRLFTFESGANGESILRAADGCIGEPLIWNVDSKSRYAWNPKAHYRNIRLAPASGVDIKSPWERSRFHDCVFLGLAYRLTREEKYPQEFARRVTDWIAQNPCPYGVNWTNAMEAGIRTINWTFAFYLMRDSRAVTPAVTLELLTSLAAHAAFIRSNLEYREAWVQGKRRRLNSNHYLCNLTGLLYVALLFPDLHLTEDRDFARSEIETELFEQTHSDGVDYEHSTSYHRFVLEGFLTAFLLLKENGYEVSAAAEERLRRMQAFASSSMHPDGTVPQIGDNDSGRILPIELLSVSPAVESAAFREGGFYSMRGRKSHVAVSAATVGMHGFGSHSHNDVLSFEYWHGGQAWIVDPGTYVYLPDPDARNWFRSTEAHNSVRVDAQEINPFHSEAIFQMVHRAGVRVHKWEAGTDLDVLEAEHTGYERLSNGVRHRRRFEFHKSTAVLAFHDSFEGKGEHLYEWFFQVPPRVEVRLENATFTLSNGVQAVRLHFKCDGAELSIIEGWYSPRYGTREPATRLLATATTSVPPQAWTTIEPC